MPDTPELNNCTREAVGKFIDDFSKSFQQEQNDMIEKLTPNDNVNHPAHYTKGSVECIQAIEASMTPEAFRGYLKGNVIKYVFRYEQKGWIESLEKAQVYLGWLIKHLTENES